MDELKSKIAKNLVELRTQAHLTQLQLAEILNYSDKAVSKWERGEAIPDIRVLIQLSELYGITLDDLVKGTGVAAEVSPRHHILSKRAFITALSVILVWFVATCVFVLFYFIPHTAQYAYLTFVVAPLPTGIVLTVFAAKWGNRITQALACSLIVWASVLIFHIYVLTFAPEFTQIYLMYAVGAVFEILIIVWFVYRWYTAGKNKRT